MLFYLILNLFFITIIFSLKFKIVSSLSFLGPNPIKKSWQIKRFVVFGYKLIIHGIREF